MRNVDITGIHALMTRNYGTQNMQLLTNTAETNLIHAYDMKIVFDYNSKYFGELHKLDKKLQRYIRGVENYFVYINRKERSVTITIFQSKLWSNFDLDFTFSKN